MKISSVPSVVVPTVNTSGIPTESKVDSIRTLQMKTNATPLTQEIPQLPPVNTDTPPEASVEATQPLSPQLALLAKQRRALQVKERELADREKAFLSRSTSTEAEMIELARLKSEPLKVLLENGVTYDQLTEAILAGQGQTQNYSEINSLKAKIEALEQGIDQKFVDKDKQAEQQVLAEMKREAEMLVKSDEYELVRETHNVPTVIRLIERTYRETGEVLDVSEALKLVEDEIFKEAQKFSTYKKMQSQMSPVATPMQSQQRQTGMRTLTNRDTASVPLSKHQRAMAAFYGTLK